MSNIEPLLDTPAVERIIGIGSGNGRALQVARHRGTINIPIVRVGKSGIRYRPADVEKWIAERAVQPDTGIQRKRVRNARRARRTKVSK